MQDELFNCCCCFWLRVPLPARSLSNNSVSSAVKFCLHFPLSLAAVTFPCRFALVVAFLAPFGTAGHGLCDCCGKANQTSGGRIRREEGVIRPRSSRLRLPFGTPRDSYRNNLNLLVPTSPDRIASRASRSPKVTSTLSQREKDTIIPSARSRNSLMSRYHNVARTTKYEDATRWNKCTGNNISCLRAIP